MRKRALALFVIVVGLVFSFAFTPAYSQEDITVLKDSAFKNRQRSAAVFVHEEHNEKAEIEECNVCHHLYEDGKKIEDESSEDQYCSDCHELKASGSIPALMKAFHMNCKECHLDQKEGPVTCGECHKK